MRMPVSSAPGSRDGQVPVGGILNKSLSVRSRGEVYWAFGDPGGRAGSGEGGMEASLGFLKHLMEIKVSITHTYKPIALVASSIRYVNDWKVLCQTINGTAIYDCEHWVLY